MWNTYEELLKSYQQTAEELERRIESLKYEIGDPDALHRAVLLQSEYYEVLDSICEIRSRLEK